MGRRRLLAQVGKMFFEWIAALDAGAEFTAGSPHANKRVRGSGIEIGDGIGVHHEKGFLRGLTMCGLFSAALRIRRRTFISGN
jgi:hypothetical protein